VEDVVGSVDRDPDAVLQVRSLILGVGERVVQLLFDCILDDLEDGVFQVHVACVDAVPDQPRPRIVESAKALLNARVVVEPAVQVRPLPEDTSNLIIEAEVRETEVVALRDRDILIGSDLELGHLDRVGAPRFPQLLQLLGHWRSEVVHGNASRWMMLKFLWWFKAVSEAVRPLPLLEARDVCE